MTSFCFVFFVTLTALSTGTGSDTPFIEYVGVILFACLVMFLCIRLPGLYLFSRVVRGFQVRLSVTDDKLTISDMSLTPQLRKRPHRMFRCKLEHCRIISMFGRAGWETLPNPPILLRIPVWCCFVRFWVQLSCGLSPEARQEWARILALAAVPEAQHPQGL